MATVVRLRGALALAFALALAALPAGSAAAAEVEPLGAGPADAASEAAARFERLLPAAVASNRSDRIEAQLVAPFLVQSGDHLSAISALGAPTIAAGAAGGFTLDTEDGALQIAPVWTDGSAPTGATVDDAAVVFPALSAGVDALVRPTAVGMTTLLRMGGPLAGREFAWSVRLSGGQRLRELDDGGIAIVAKRDDDGKKDAVKNRERRKAIHDAARLGDARGQYDEGRAEHAAARARVGRVVAVIHPPEAQDAAGNPVTTKLEAKHDLVTLTVDHRSATVSYPVAASLTASYPSSWERRWTRIPGIGPAQHADGNLIRALMPSGKVFMTHGFDPKPKGKPVAPPPEEYDDGFEQRGEFLDEEAAEASGATRAGVPTAAGGTTGGPTGLPHVCAGPDTRRLTLVYAGPTGAAGLTPAVKRRIRRVFATMNTKLYREALESGGPGNPARYRVTCDEEGRAEILAFEDHHGDPDLDVVDVLNGAIAHGIDDPDSKYLIFDEFAVEGICGIGDVLEGDQLKSKSPHNGLTVMNPSDTVEGGWALLFGRECWEADFGMHENAHTMGAVQPSAPGANGSDQIGPRFHCNDGLDVMCYQEDHEPYSSDVCTLGPNGVRFDCNYDSYFDTDTESGEYLSRHWNIGSTKNRFLSFDKPPAEREPFVFSATRDLGETASIWRAGGGSGDPAFELLDSAGCICPYFEVPALSPNGHQVAFLTDRDGCRGIYTIPYGGGSPRRAWDCRDFEGATASNVEYASRNGLLAFDFTPIGGSGTDVWTVKTDGTALTQVTDWPGSQYAPSFSGSGLQVAFVSDTSRQGTIFGGEQHLFIANADGSGAVDMTGPSDFRIVFNPTFSPDGNWISFEGIRRDDPNFTSHVYAARVDGSELLRADDGDSAGAGGWTADGRLLYVEPDPEHATATTKVFSVEDEGRETMSIGLALPIFSLPGYRQPSYFVEPGIEPPQPVPIAPGS